MSRNPRGDGTHIIIRNVDLLDHFGGVVCSASGGGAVAGNSVGIVNSGVTRYYEEKREILIQGSKHKADRVVSGE